MRHCTLAGEREVLVTDETIYDNDCEMTGAEIGELMKQLEPFRLETLWREAHRHYPLRFWVAGTGRTRKTPDQVIGYRRGRRGNCGHMLKSRTQPRGTSPASPPSRRATRTRHWWSLHRLVGTCMKRSCPR